MVNPWLRLAARGSASSGSRFLLSPKHENTPTSQFGLTCSGAKEEYPGSSFLKNPAQVTQGGIQRCNLEWRWYFLWPFL